MTEFYTNFFAHRDQVYIRGYDAEGKQFAKKHLVDPIELYTTKKTESPSEFKTLAGDTLYALHCSDFDSYKDTLKFATERLYGNRSLDYWEINKMYGTEFGMPQMRTELIRIAGIDLECRAENGFPNPATADQEILLISVAYQDVIYTLGTQPFEPKDPKVKYVLCQDEATLLSKFYSLWAYINPDVVTGWNVEFFDIPYIVNRTRIILGDKKVKELSPWRMVYDREVNKFGEDVTIYDIKGISTLDYLSLYEKYTPKKKESSKLDFIAKLELGEEKKKNPYKTFREFYEKSWDQFVEYNIHDIRLVFRLEKKLKYISLVYMIAYQAKVNFNDVYSQVKMWENLIQNYLYWKMKILQPLKARAKMAEDKAGGYVKIPDVGFKEWVVTYDATSLYPSLMMMYNMSPETYVDILEKPIIEDIFNGKAPSLDDHPFEYCVAGNGARFRTDIKGFLPIIIDEMFKGRKAFKDKMLAVQKYKQRVENELRRRKPKD